EPCINLCLQQKSCPNGATTSISGVVHDPAGKVGLYNVIVYVPNGPVAALTPGIGSPSSSSSSSTCDRCGTISGKPLVSTLTGTDGRFKLENVPVGVEFPLIIQIGKWRRQIKVPAIAPNSPGDCAETLLDAELTRLPKKKSEGDLPQIALTTGA